MGLRIFVYFIVSLMASYIQTHAAEVSVHQINGYTVIIADIKKGNSTHIELRTPNGAFHDPVELAGIAHYTEHMMFNGTRKNPGITLGRLLNDIGAQNNASTGFLTTTYYSDQHESHALQALEYWGQAFSIPAFENSKIELETVTREIDGDALNEDEFLTAVSTFYLALADGHPLKQMLFGTHKELSRITVDDVQRIFWSHAAPGGLTILVSGNFSATGEEHLTKDQVLESIRANFNPPAIPTDARLFTRGDLQKVAPYSNGGSLPFIHIRSRDDKRVLTVKLLSDNPGARGNYQARKILVDFLNLDAPGSLIRELKDAGFVTSAKVSESSNLQVELTEFAATLTESGYRNLDDVMNRFWVYLAKIRKHGIPDVLLRLFVEDLSVQLEEAELSAEAFAAWVHRLLFLGAEEAVRLSQASAWGDLSHSQIIEAASLFNPNHAIVSLSAPDAPEPNEIFVSKIGGADETKKREAFRRDTSGTVDRWHEILRQPFPQLNTRVQVVPHRARGARPLDLATAAPRKLMNTKDGVDVYLEEAHQIAKAGTVVRLQLPLLETKDQAYLEILVRGFLDRHAAELSFFSLKNLIGGIRVGANQIQVIGKGDPLGGLDFIKWFFSQLVSYVPNVEEIKKARQEISDEASSSLQTRPYIIAFTGAQDQLLRNAPTELQLNEAAKALSDDEILHHDRGFLTTGDFIISAAGDLADTELKELAQHLRESIPISLSSADRHNISTSIAQWTERARSWIQLHPPKNANDFGYLRAIRLQGRSPEELAMGEVLRKMLDTNVFEYNRETQSLGYAHGAFLENLRGASHFMIFGDVDSDDDQRETKRTGFEKFGLMIAGIRDVVLGLVGKAPHSKLNWTDDQISALVQGLIADFRQAMTDPVEAANTALLNVLRSGEPQSRAQIADALEKITPDQVRAAAAAQVLERPYWEFVASVPPERDRCLQALASL